MMEPRRGPGRPPKNGGGAAKVPPPEPPKMTATAELERLQAMRLANGGLVLPPPESWQAAALTFPAGIARASIGEPNQPLKDVLAWFEALAAAGASGADLVLAWELWRPTAFGEAHPKHWAEPRFDAIRNAAGKRHAELVKRAEREALPLKVVEACRRDLRLAQERLASEQRRHIAPLQNEVDRCRRLLDQAEANLKQQEAA